MKRLVINATYLKGESLSWDKGSLWIESGVIHFLEQSECERRMKEADEVIDANGWIGLPAFADLHVHFREPGFEQKETLKTGLEAAAKGGFTLVAAMPNTKPVVDSLEKLEAIEKKARTVSSVELLQYASVTIGQKGEEIVDIEGLTSQNHKLFSEDGREVESDDIFKGALHRSTVAGGLVATHCEDHAMTAHHTEKPYPPEGEWRMVERDLDLADQVKAGIHIAHLSTKESLELVRKAKERGQKVTAEVAPHHLFFDADQLNFETAFYKVNPPLRNAKHVAALMEGIKDGTVDLIASDHAPHEIETKRCAYGQGSYGFSSLEVSFSAAHTALRSAGIGLRKLVELMSFAPRSLLGRSKNPVQEGVLADIVFVNLDERFILKETDLVSKGKNCPYVGHELIGAVKCLISGDKILYRSDDSNVG
jgi:dihydroorotase